MNGWSSGRTPGLAVLPSGLEQALTEVRDRTSGYRRWLGECRTTAPDGPGSTPPWSERDEELVGKLAAVDPWWVRSVADELEKAHTRLRDIGAELARIADSGIGPAAGARCVQLAATIHERATEAAALASGACAAGDRADDLLDELTKRLAELVEGLLGGGSGPAREPRRPGVGPGGVFDGYEAVLRAVRDQLRSAVDQLPTLVGIHPGDRAGSARWTDPSGPAVPGGGGWTPEPGTGPRLPGTDAHRVETDVGVRIARLTDGPAG